MNPKYFSWYNGKATGWTTAPTRSEWFCGPPRLLPLWVLSALSPGIKRQGREPTHPPPAIVEFMSEIYFDSPIRVHTATSRVVA
jgi:hypothetical protein